MTEFVVLGVILLALILVMNQNLDFFFWITIIFYFDPGGFVAGFLDGNLISVFNLSDVLIPLILYAILTAKNKPKLKDDKDFWKLLKYIIIFQIYYVLFYGLITPYFQGRENFLFFLLKNRSLFHVIPILIGTYIFSGRSLHLFFRILLGTTTVVLTAYMITLLTGIELVYVFRGERYATESGMLRIGMVSYGFMDWLYPIALVSFLLYHNYKVKIAGYYQILYAGFLMMLTILLTLTRRELLSYFFTTIITGLLFGYLFKISKLKSISKFLWPALFIIIVFSLFYPSGVGNIAKLFVNTVSLIVSGEDTEGRSDYRVRGSGDLEMGKEFISENIILGTGYIPWIWADQVQAKLHGDQLAIAQDAANEVPIYGVFLQFGIIGFLLIVLIFVTILKGLVDFLKLARFYGFRNYDVVRIVLLIFGSVFLIGLFTHLFYSTPAMIYNPYKFVSFAGFLGVFYSLTQNHKLFINSLKK